MKLIDNEKWAVALRSEKTKKAFELSPDKKLKTGQPERVARSVIS